MRRILCLLLVLCLMLSVTACGDKKDNDKPSSNVSGGYTQSDEKDYNDTVSEWENEGENEGEFGEETNSAPTHL